MGLLNTFAASLQALSLSQKDKSKLDAEAPLPQQSQESQWRPKDTYQILKQLQEGEEGRCSVVRSVATANVFVIKQVHYMPSTATGVLPTETGRRRPLPNEVRTLMRLRNHENVIRYFNNESTGEDLCFIYLEFRTGGDLLEQLWTWQTMKIPTPPAFVLHMLVGLAQALAFIHHGIRYTGNDEFSLPQDRFEPIIHGDIKPDNIFLRWPGSSSSMPGIVLADFGMAKFAVDSFGITGTPGYDSPEVRAVAKLCDSDPAAYEVAKRSRTMSTKSDVYQIGLIIHLMATGKHFGCGKNASLISLPERCRGVVGLLPFLIWCLQPEPQERFDCSVDVENGILEAVNLFRVRRDLLLTKDGTIPQDQWNRADVSGRRSG